MEKGSFGIFKKETIQDSERLLGRPIRSNEQVKVIDTYSENNENLVTLKTEDAQILEYVGAMSLQVCG